MSMQARRIVLVMMALALLGVLAVSVADAQGTVPRNQQVIIDIDSTSIANPTDFNPYLPSNIKNVGMHQLMLEPLFITNYETGKIDPWLGVSFTPNDKLDVWTLKLRDGIKWSDGQPYNADDVVFSINLLLNDKTKTLDYAADMQQWVTAVKKIDDTTV